MSRIFISHSSHDNAWAIKIRDWLTANGWDDVFLDLDPVRGLAPGERWQNALKTAADRCQAVIFLISQNWLNSRWCLSEYLLTKQLGKRLFPLLLDDVDLSSLPADMAADHQAVNLDNDPQAWERLKQGLRRAGLDADSFSFMPGRRPYPGFEPLTEEDAAIFFGRDAQILRGLDRLRLMRDAGAERVLVVLGASGAGKSSFLRAGLWPRLRRDDRNFWPLPVIRPERAVLTGRAGLYAALEGALTEKRLSQHRSLTSFPRSRSALGQLVEREGLSSLLMAIRLGATARLSDDPASSPTLVLSIDQGEELLNEEGREESQRFLKMLATVLGADRNLLTIICIRSDAYPHLQADPRIAGIAREPFDLPPMPEGSLRSVIEGPARFAAPPLKLEPALVDAVLEEATGQDALPLLAFMLNRLARDHGADGALTLRQYQAGGGIHGVIIAAVEEALVRGRSRGVVPSDESSLEMLLRQAFVPHLARVNEAGEFARRVATTEDIPITSRPLVDLLVEERLLIRDQSEQGEVIEVAHEALLREWSVLRQFLEADREFLVGKRQLADDLAIWQAAAPKRRGDALLTGLRLNRAQQWLAERAAHEFSPLERNFIGESVRATQKRQRWRTRAAAAVILLLASFSALAAWQWTRARQAAANAEQNAATASAEKTRAEQNAVEAKAEKERADQNAAEAQRYAADVREQRDRAEREALAARRQAERSDARAELIQSQFAVRDAPRDALGRAYRAAQKLDGLGSANEGVPLLGDILNIAREIPTIRPYGHYNLNDAKVFARMRRPDNADIAGVQPDKKVLTVIGSDDVTGLIDDEGHAVGRPIGSSDADRSHTNDAAWLDDGHFVLATGMWAKDNETKEFVLRNPALRVYQTDGTPAEEYLPSHSAPVTSVSILKHEKQRIVLSGDAAGNLIIKPDNSAVEIISTGIAAPIIKLLVVDSEKKSSLIVVFGKVDPEQTPASSVGAAAALDIEEQKHKIEAALKLPAAISFLGEKPSEDIRCADIEAYTVYVCDRNTITVLDVDYDTGKLESKPDYILTGHKNPITAVALSPTSPILATGSTDGQIKLWMRKTAQLLSEFSARDQISALGFINDGGQLLSGSSYLRSWDLADLGTQLKKRFFTSNAYLMQENWANFLDESNQGLVSDAVATLLKENEQSRWAAHGRFLLASTKSSLRIIDTQKATLREVALAATPRTDDDGDIASEDSTETSTGGSSTVCVLHGASSRKMLSDPKDQKSGTRRLYAVDIRTGMISAEWPLPAELLKEYSGPLASQEVAGGPTCWAAGGRSIFSFSVSDGSVKEFSMAEEPGRSIDQLVPLDTNTFLAAAQSSGVSTVWLLQSENSGSQNAGATGSPITNTVALASTRIQGELDKITANADGTRIAIAIRGGRHNDGVQEVRLFDRNFNTLMAFPGSPDNFGVLRLSRDGTKVRGTASDLIYEQDIELQSRLASAKNRLDLWANEDDRAAIYRDWEQEKDREKRKLILRNGYARRPSDTRTALLLANAEFYTAADASGRNHAMHLYDHVISIDPHHPLGHYMRGRARNALGDGKGAVEDFSAAIALPHILPLVKVVAGFLGINQGIAALSRQLNLQAKGELYLRRAFARSQIGEWRTLIDEDAAWLRQKAMLGILGHELEAFALRNVGESLAAVASYEKAAELLEAGKGYAGFEEFGKIEKDAAWRTLRIALYKKQIGEIYHDLGRRAEATAAHASGRKLIVDASALPDLTAQSRAMIEQFSFQEPQERCASEASFRSSNSLLVTQVKFVNGMASPVRLYWLDFDGQRKLYDTINAGAESTKTSYGTHPWLIADANDNCLAIHLPEIGFSTVTIP